MNLVNAVAAPWQIRSDYLFHPGGDRRIIYLAIFSLPFPLARFYATTPPVDYAKLTQHSPGGLAAFLGGLLVLFALYLRLLKWDLTPALPLLAP